jgi:signal transduction histidine kinase/DNA-binding NarL/FixJ family response regulator
VAALTGLSGLETLLLIEQSPGSLERIREFLSAGRQLLLPFDQRDTAPDLISRERIGLVFCDLPADDPRGMLLLEQIHRVHPHLPVLPVVPPDANATALEAFRRGAADVLFRPLATADIDRAMERVRRLCDSQRSLSRQQSRTARSLDDLVLLQTIGATTSSEENLQRLLERVVEAIQMALHVDIVSLMLCNDGGQLEIRAARGLPAEVVAEVRVAPGEGVAGHVLVSGEPVLIDDLASDGRFRLSEKAGRYRSGSLLSVPIGTQDRVIGVLNVNNKHDRESFSAADQELLAMIGHQAALAIENLKLVGRLREQSQALEQAHADLLHLHHDRTRFVCNLSHELKTPLTSILGFADLLVNFFDQIGVQEVREYLGRIHAESLHLERLLEGMLRLFAIDSGRVQWQWEKLVLPVCIDETLASHLLALADLDLAVDREIPADLAAVRADRDKLLILLDALIDNAIKFNRNGGSIRIRAENRRVGDRPYVYLSIANDGRTVLPEHADLIFQQYSQMGDLDTDKPCGVGIGLATCRAILRQMQGTIFLEPVNGEGTCLGLLLPVATDHEEDAHANPERS